MDNLYTDILGFIDLYTFVNGMHHFRMKAGISKDTLHTLFYIKVSDNEVTPKQLAQYFNVSKPRVTNVIRPLIKKGYLTTYPSTLDKRSYSLCMTIDGETFLKNALQDLYHLHELLIEQLGFGDYIQLVELTKKANEIFESKKR